MKTKKKKTATKKPTKKDIALLKKHCEAALTDPACPIVSDYEITWKEQPSLAPSKEELLNKPPKILKMPYYGFNHNKVKEHFEGELTFLNEFSIKGDTWAVYSNKNPNREKKHKDYLLLKAHHEYDLEGNVIPKTSSVIFTGLDEEDMKTERYQNGIYCPKCGDVIFSMHRHDYHKCTCGECMVDGGKDYLRFGGNARVVKLDLLTDKIFTEK